MFEGVPVKNINYFALTSLLKLFGIKLPITLHKYNIEILYPLNGRAIKMVRPQKIAFFEFKSSFSWDENIFDGSFVAYFIDWTIYLLFCMNKTKRTGFLYVLRAKNAKPPHFRF